jgi:hypothetical protein
MDKGSAYKPQATSHKPQNSDRRLAFVKYPKAVIPHNCISNNTNSTPQQSKRSNSMSDIISITDRIIEGYSYIKNQGLQGDNYLRAFYFEIENNLELLSLLDEDVLPHYSPKTKNSGNTAIFSYLGGLQTTVAAYLLFDDAGGKAAAPALKKLAKDEETLWNIATVVKKIEVLHRIAGMGDEQKALLHGIDLKKRVENIIHYLKAIRTALYEIEGVRKICPPIGDERKKQKKVKA